MLDILHLRPFDYSHIQVDSLRICSLCLVARGSLVFSVLNLVFVLVVLSISLCKCRFFDLYLVFLRCNIVGNIVFLSLVCSLSYLFHCTRSKGLFSHCLCFSRLFLVLHFVPFVAATLSVFVCKARVATCCHLRARKEVLVHVRSADILTLLEGSLQIARNVAIILEEQTSRLRRNQSGTVQAPFCSWVRLTFLARRARRTIVVSS